MNQKITGIILTIFLIAFPSYLVYELYYMDKVFFLCPIDYKQDTMVIRSDSYGNGDFLARRNGLRRHNGIDLKAPIGTPVYAARAGKVLRARFHKGMGNYVQLLHPSGYITIYGHLSRISVREKQLVRQGDKIGEVGKTGNANYHRLIPHLHLEVRNYGVPLDPMAFLSN